MACVGVAGTRPGLVTDTVLPAALVVVVVTSRGRPFSVASLKAAMRGNISIFWPAGTAPSVSTSRTIFAIWRGSFSSSPFEAVSSLVYRSMPLADVSSFS